MKLQYVVVSLSVALLAALAGIVFLAAQGINVPTVLEYVAVGALSALAGVLVPTKE